VYPNSLIHLLPSINATLNATSAVLLLLGWRAVRRHQIDRHRGLMISAAIVSAAFLVCYVAYHARVGSVHFTATGAPRTIYFTILITHTILAVAIVPLVLRTLWLGLKRRDDRHRGIARWTFPLWLYVSVTGVVIYLMLYRIYPSSAMPR
jgi:uncharacterized membrane protein YozB (DUF420 family)